MKNIILKFNLTIEFIYKNIHFKELRKLINKEINNKSGIYAFVNIENNNTYIGSAKNLKNRFKQHYNGLRSNIILQKAIKKYGIDNFYFIVLEYCEIKDLISREQFYIDQLQPTYNILFKAGSTLGYKHSEEILKSLSGENHPLFSKTHSEKSKIKISESLIGLLKSEETKNKISNTMKSKELSRVNNPFYGKTHSEESINKIKIAISGINHYNYGKIAKNAKLVYLYDSNNNLIKNFNSKTELAEYLKISRFTINKYLKSGEI
jgi:group I intron endonuclease